MPSGRNSAPLSGASADQHLQRPRTRQLHARLELYLTELVYDLLRIDYPLCRQILNWQKEELRGLLHCVDAQAAACDPRAGLKPASHRPVKKTTLGAARDVEDVFHFDCGICATIHYFFVRAIARDGFFCSHVAQEQQAGGRMTISTLILVLLLTFGAACALDRLARSLRML